MKTITSRQNPTVRLFRELAENPDPSGERILLDGVHLVRDARAAGMVFEAVAVHAARLAAPSEEGDLARQLEADGFPVLSTSTPAVAAISPVTSPSGIVAIARRPLVEMDALVATADALVIAAIDVQDPGNLGSIIRAAEAGGATGAIAGGASANPFSWKALRGSMGSALRLPVATARAVGDVLAAARRAGARTVASVARGGADPDTVDWSGRVLLLLGGEGAGLPDDIATGCDERVTIPMAAGVESLNVAVAAGILVYAARRRRLLTGGR